MAKLWVKFKTNNATQVSTEGCQNVDDLLKACKKEFSPLLDSYAPAQLVLSTTADGPPIRPGLLLTDIPSLPGYSKNDDESPLFISVAINALPQEYVTQGVVIGPSQAKSSLFSSCQIPFYNNICNATENDGWITFDDDIPSTKLKRLYVRESYKSIASNIPPEIKKSIITGTPGIGKSWFMIYLLWKLVKAGKRVLFVYYPHTIYYDDKGNIFQFLMNELPSEIDYSFWNADLWCLFDAKEKFAWDLRAFSYPTCAFVLSMSPRREMINDFKKPPPPQTFYMPLWTETELGRIAAAFPGVADWQERFRILGGIPRYVLEVTSLSPNELLVAACRNCELDDCIKIIGLNSTITDKSKAIHSLIHIISTDPFKQSSVTFASQTALDIIVKIKGEEAKLKTRQLLAACEGNPLTASLCGYIFEPYAIEMLEKGGEFTYRQLVHGNTKLKPADRILTIPPSTKLVVENVEVGQTENQLYVAKTSNFTAIDAWIPGIGAFQMTVGKTHDIKAAAQDKLALLGANGKKLYWLLPPQRYDSFTKKTPHEIDQYALRIPFPE